MKAALLQETGKVVIQTFGRPTIGPHEVLIRVEYAGVCGSDVHAYHGTHPFRKPPVILGHEVAGRIVALGEAVQGFAIGDAVTVMPYLHCGHCPPCLRGQTNVCLHKRVPGTGDWLGTFAEYFGADAAITYKLGPHTDTRRGVLAEPLAVGIHALRRGGMGSGSRVLVLGGGTIGLLTALAARLAGATDVALTDLYDHKLDIARAVGIEAAYNARQANLVETIRRQHPEGFDVICLASGAAITVEQALALIQRGGRVVVTAMFTAPVLTDLLAVTLGEVELVGTQIYTDADFRQALHWLEQQGDVFELLISRVYPLEAARDALHTLSERPGEVIKVLLHAGAED